MRTKPIHILIIIIAFTGIIVSCQKGRINPDLPSVQITEQDNGKTISISQGEILKINLGNPGDGGYDFDAPQYNLSVLSLKDHVHTPPATNRVGDFGRDTWEFSATKTGTTVLTIIAMRPWDKNNQVAMFTGNVLVH
jgi:predicted secreted protein